MCLEFLAEQELTTSAVEALIAKLGVALQDKQGVRELVGLDLLGNNTVADLETLDSGANRCNDSDSFMAY